MEKGVDETQQILEEVRAALLSEPRYKPAAPLNLEIDDGTLAIEGEVSDVAVKKRLLRRAAAHAKVIGILDRLRVTPAQPMGDKEIRDHVCNGLLQEPALSEISLKERVKGEDRLVRDGGEGQGEICIDVEDGVVLLDGDVPTLAHKRLAGVLSWWVPGSRDVINGLGELSPETELDAEITDSIRTALEKDPFVNAGQIRVMTHDRSARLEGLVPTDSEREMAEFDAWYVIGVDDVDNKIIVRA